MTTVSVIIPTYNRPDWLSRAAESVAAQTVTPDELIVVNDGSDRDYSSARDTIDSLPIETHYFETSGDGATAARNYGAAQASGDILMFLDDDDRWRPNKVERQIENLTGDDGLIYSGRIAVNHSGEVLYRINGKLEGDLSEPILFSNVIGTTSGPAISAKVFDSVGGFDEEMPALQDWELWIRICQEVEVFYDPANTVEWTIHDSPEEQITGQAERYHNAIQLLWDKHSDLFFDLPWTHRRRAKAAKHKALAKAHANAKSWKRHWHCLRSLTFWPSLGAAARLLPQSIQIRLRTFLSKGTSTNSPSTELID